MEPEREIAAAPTVVNNPSGNDNAKPKPHGHLTPHLPIELDCAEDPRRQIHRHEPQRDRYDRDNEGESVEAQRDHTRDDGGDLHENKTAFDPVIEVVHRARLAERAPPTKLFLNAIDREWRHR